jgi:altronate dehydratase
MSRRSLLLDPADNVAVALDDLSPRERVSIDGGSVEILEAIPFGHKFALRDIRQGGEVTKYGETIGIATRPLRSGAHVHVHNVRSLLAGPS